MEMEMDVNEDGAPACITPRRLARTGSLSRMASTLRPEQDRVGRVDDTIGNPHRAQISQFELPELKFINSSCSSLSSC